MAHPATSFATEVYLLARRHLDNLAAGGGTMPESIAAQLLADGEIALRGLHDEQRVKWVETESAFASRIQVGGHR